ncbi:MAG TPA: hypothetical protein VJ984_02260 [Xanthomonadales bacterium]|nr:hypothetical protein [Xanthomonadales bacterium]
MIRLTMFLAAILLASSYPTMAQEGPEGNVAEAWIVNVDMASQPAFEEAFKAHVDVRKKHNDPFEWHVYVQETGNSMSTYMIRACCFAWAEKDAYETWGEENPEVNADWGEYVHPHVSSYGHHYSTLDFANSNWPDDGSEINFVGVTSYQIKTGHSAQFEAVKAELSQIALNEGWAQAGHHWAWTSSVDGANTVNLAVPHENFASMATPDPDFFQFLSQHLGSEEAAAGIFQRFTDATDGSDYTIYRHRSDLSMSDSDQ